MSIVSRWETRLKINHKYTTNMSQQASKIVFSPEKLSQLLRPSTNAIRTHQRYIPSYLHGVREDATGNKVSEFGNKTKRQFLPHIEYKFLFSRSLDMNILCRVSSKTIKTIDKKGGFDEYVTTTRDELINNEWGLFWKRKILEKQKTV